LVEAASGGTLFLDEVGDIPLPMQVKLLRLLESGTYRRVGSTELRRTDVRVVSATHRELRTMVADGRFREDLYYRLSTFPIRLPALRERAGDIPLLAAALLDRVAPDRPLALSRDALARLHEHAFPGNVRELRNVLERAALLTDGTTIERGHIERALSADAPLAPASMAAPLTPGEAKAMGPGAEMSLRDMELAALRAQVQGHQGSRAELASKLGISERSLYRKLKELDEDPPGR
jgi:DNA-binding NtrC family response regulator